MVAADELDAALWSHAPTARLWCSPSCSEADTRGEVGWVAVADLSAAHRAELFAVLGLGEAEA
jgi:hypothetical protein